MVEFSDQSDTLQVSEQPRSPDMVVRMVKNKYTGKKEISTVLEDAVNEGKKGVTITLEVIPNARKREIGYDKWRKAITVKVKNPPKKGKANMEVIEFLSGVFDAQIEIVSGQISGRKVVRVVNKTKDEVVGVLKSIVYD